MPVVIVCASRIERVAVYARGAIVTRRIEVPSALPVEACELSVPGVTASAELGSLRVLVDDRGEGPGREVAGVRARLVVPPAPVQAPSLAAAVRALGLERARLASEVGHLRWRRDLLGGVALEPELVRRSRRLDPAARIADALAVSGLLSAELEALDARLAVLEREVERVARAEEVALLEAAQAATAEVRGEPALTLEALVRLAPGCEGPAPSLLLEYAVRAARWWPAYTARFSRGATRVTWYLDAFVAQASGEDWKDATLALSTADLVEDARLPELASLRLGRAQPPPRRGYRPAPEGLEEMFEGFDRFVAALPGGGAGQHHVAAAIAAPRAALLEGLDDDLETSVEGLAALDGLPGGGFGPPPGGPAAFGSLPPSSVSRLAPSGPPLFAARKAPAPQASSPRGGFGPPPPAPRASYLGRREELLAEGALGEGGGGAPGHRLAAIEPADAWLDFDALRLPGLGDHGRRGRLAREDLGRGRIEAERAEAMLEQLSPPLHAVDPRASRGHFDHLYSAAGTADVPSSGRPHRVALASAEAPAAPHFVAVPREVAEVYREVEVANPFGAPLLAGPVDLFVDGALTAQSSIAYVDRGGAFRAGLGVEDRLRVARNARVEESGAGLLGGALAVQHEVTIDLSSSLGKDVIVEVIDRIPVTDEKDLEIKLVSSQPKAQPYTQEDLGAPVRRGLRWSVQVPAGGKATVAFTYRLTLSAKNEIVGGNRRE